MNKTIDWDKPFTVNGHLARKTRMSGSHIEAVREDGKKFVHQYLREGARPDTYTTSYFDPSPDAINFGWDGYEPLIIENVTMPAIDTTKPLYVINSGGERIPATFITKTSEGHILIDTPKLTMNWSIFTTEGKFVRSNDGTGSALRLANNAVVTHGYHATAVNDGGYVYTKADSLETARKYGEGPVIKTTITDGIITAVELVK